MAMHLRTCPTVLMATVFETFFLAVVNWPVSASKARTLSLALDSPAAKEDSSSDALCSHSASLRLGQSK